MSSSPSGAVTGLRGRLSGRRAVAGELISLAQLLRRPVVDPTEARVGRVSDIVVRWEAGVKHPRVIGVLMSVGRGFTFVAARDATLEQWGVRLRSKQFLVATPERHKDDVVLARDLLDHQLIDIAGVQVVRAADVYLARIPDGWELAGIDVGLRSLVRRLLPQRRHSCPPPNRAIDWADLHAFVPRSFDPTSPGIRDPAAGAGTIGSSVQLASTAGELHKLRARQVASLLDSLGRREQAQLAVLTDSSTAAEVLRELDPAKLDALLAELDETDRARLLVLLSEQNARRQA